MEKDTITLEAFKWTISQLLYKSHEITVGLVKCEDQIDMRLFSGYSTYEQNAQDEMVGIMANALHIYNELCELSKYQINYEL